MRLREIFETVRDKTTKKTSLEIDDLDFMMDHAGPTGQKIRGLEVWEGDPSEIQEDGEFMLLIKDPRRDGFVAGLEINRAPEGYHFTQVFMVPELQGKNIAIEMYKMAIKDFGFIIATDETQTKGAESIWRKLAKTPGIDVYAWNTAKDSFHHWDPDEDDTTNVYYDQDEIDELNKEKKEFRGELMKQLMNGEISKDDFKDQLQAKFDKIDSYIKSLTDVKTDKVLLVAKETDGNDLSESSLRIHYSGIEEFNRATEELYKLAETVELSENPFEKSKEFAKFIDQNSKKMTPGKSYYILTGTASPPLSNVVIREYSHPFIFLDEEGEYLSFENHDGEVVEFKKDYGNVLVHFVLGFVSEQDMEHFKTLVSMKYGWKIALNKL